MKATPRLKSEEHRLRNITHLQQRAQALENEILERKRAEHELRIAHDDLEKRVIERTLELQQKNVQIQKQAARLWRRPIEVCASFLHGCCAFRTKSEGESPATCTTAPVKCSRC